MSFIALAVVFAGYQLGWYGWTNIHGEGMGFMELLKPSQVQKVQKWLDSNSNTKTSSTSTATSSVNGLGDEVGVTDGSSNNVSSAGYAAGIATRKLDKTAIRKYAHG